MKPQTESLPLYDIHLPDPVSAWPPAPGWWLLLALVIIAALVAAFWWRRQYRQQQRRRDCLQQLQNLRSHFDKTDAQACAQVNEILKLYCLRHFPQAVALHGQSWVDFLNQNNPVPLFHHQSARALAEAPYAPDRNDWRQHYGDFADLLALAQRWLNNAQAPQQQPAPDTEAK
ncbi:MAG: DUF4381 domain-containing protein [Saccharospirillaceae bacterium]|nr:DUF4381 domain-containing protein [Saccharospirillaceae bacterium]MCD8530479.1 DUF4381 domain-containing protein [Saccharospirillaceae bacterium]